MTHPVLVLRPPERRGQQIALSADLLLGHDDQVTVSALVGPDTQAWVRQNGRKLLGDRFERAKRLLGRYVRLDGDWGKLGDIGACVFDVARGAAASSRLTPPGDASREAASTYLALSGRLGPDAQAAAEQELEAMQAAAAQGNQAARYSRHLLDTAHAMSTGLAPDSAEALEMCRALDQSAPEPCCEECAAAERDSVAGACCAACAAAVTVPYAAEDAVLMPDETADRVAGMGAAALGYRALRRVAPRLSMREAAAQIYGIVGQPHQGWGVPPILAPSSIQSGWGVPPIQRGSLLPAVHPPEPTRSQARG